MNARFATHWSPEDPAFWQVTGKPMAHRNLWISIANLLVAFSVWMLWSVVVVTLPAAGFAFTATQLFWLVALPGLTGALLRPVYGFAAPRLEGRGFMLYCTLSLLLPVVGLGVAVQHPQTPYAAMLALAALCGLGGGSFASSMTSLTGLFPRREVGSALSLNAGLGNLGVSLVQFVTPLVITLSTFSLVSGAPQWIVDDAVVRPLWLQNAAFIWVPLIIACALLARFGMYEMPPQRIPYTQAPVFLQARYWVFSLLYLGTLGSFIGFSAAFPLFAHLQFPAVDTIQYVFLGPLMGALSRPPGGWLAERFGGGTVTFWSFGVMACAVIVCMVFLPGAEHEGSFWGVMFAFMVLFLASGVGNGAMFHVLPAAIGGDRAGPDPHLDVHEAGRVIGLVSSVGALGGFVIPVLFALALTVWNGMTGALFLFVVFYAGCMVMAWWFHMRGRRGTPSSPIPGERGG